MSGPTGRMVVRAPPVVPAETTDTLLYNPRMNLRRCVPIALLCLPLAACGARHGGTTQSKPELKLILKPWGEVGQQAYPGDEVALKVVALKSAGADIQTSEDLVPAVGEAIAWRILGTPGGEPRLSSAATPTDSAGLAQITVDVGVSENVAVQVEASATGADSVVFTVQVRADARHLELLVPPTISSVVNRAERLRVRLVRTLPGTGSGPPIPDVPLKIELKGGVRANGAALEATATDTVIEPGWIFSVTTDSTGVASIRFKTGSTPQPAGYTIEFCGGGACPNIAAVTLTVRVTNGTGAGQCQYFTDCEVGYVCDNGNCVPAANYCDGDADCPIGYHCDADRLCALNTCAEICYDNGDCNPTTQKCGSGGCCIPADGCMSSNDCPTGWTCDAQSGACLPPTNIPAMDVRGLWYTVYHFDISDTLPGFFQNGLGPVVDFLNLLFASQLEIDIPIIGDVIEAIIDSIVEEYVPPWVQTIVAILADFIHLFENMEAEGEMMLTQTPTTPTLGTNVSGIEDWLSARFYVVSFCPGGPAEFAVDPSCGQIDVVMDPTVPVDYSDEDLRVGVEVSPFLGEVMGRVLKLNGRDVKFGMRQLINVVLDTVTIVASNGDYADFEEFLVDIVPCADVQASFDDLMCDITDGDFCSMPGVEAACEAASLAATAALSEALGNVELQVFHVEFDQRANIYDNPVGGEADVLGSPADPTNNAESALAGTTGFTFFGGDLDDNSWWYGVRDFW
jgi:hypothetical protein